ncbi:MAG: hypothetical protein ACP5JW_02875 [Candidatus Bathyarchaeia archaeon]
MSPRAFQLTCSAIFSSSQEISIGKVIGGNIITITIVLGIVALIRTFTVTLQEILTTVPFMILVTLVLSVMNRRSHKITRAWSILMLVIASEPSS